LATKIPITEFNKNYFKFQQKENKNVLKINLQNLKIIYWIFLRLIQGEKSPNWPFFPIFCKECQSFESFFALG
jgi:hypothetical protein